MTDLVRQSHWDAASLNIVKSAGGATIKSADVTPTLWWSHNPAGWCLSADADVAVTGDEWNQETVAGRRVWFAQAISAVIIAVRRFWFVETDGSRHRVEAYQPGARKAIQYAALVHGIDATTARYVVVSTTRITKSQALYKDVCDVQRKVSIAFGFPAPLWTVWVQLGAFKDANGQPLTYRLTQGAEVSPPRVLRVGWTKTENWARFRELQALLTNWGAEVGEKVADDDLPY